MKPKSFAGLFGAAPSVALATLALAVHKHGPAYGSIEGRSMILGAICVFPLCLAGQPSDNAAEVAGFARYCVCAGGLAVCSTWNGALGSTLRVKVNLGALRRSKWYEYVVRFAFGGAVTVLAGAIANHYGPNIGGLFLAFPAIFPATATLLEKHEKTERTKLFASSRSGGN